VLDDLHSDLSRKQQMIDIVALSTVCAHAVCNATPPAFIVQSRRSFSHLNDSVISLRNLRRRGMVCAECSALL
jgi:hypothetical protein